MDPTALPTDNLWKFMALAGLALAGFCAWLNWKMRETHYAAAAQLREELNARNANLDALAKESTASHNQTRALVGGLQDRLIKGTLPVDEAQARFEKLASARDAKADEIEAEVKAAGIAVAEVSERVTTLEKRWSRYGEALRALTLGIYIGFGTSVLGFCGWYLNAQWYTDRQTKADFEDHMQELAAKRIARDKAAHEAKP